MIDKITEALTVEEIDRIERSLRINARLKEDMSRRRDYSDSYQLKCVDEAAALRALAARILEAAKVRT